MKISSLLSSVSVSALAVGGAHADVLVVDSTGAGEYTSIGVALATATDGDVVLVRPGSYAGAVTIDGKSVSVLAELDGSVEVDARVLVQNTSAVQPVVLSGLTLSRGFQFVDCAGRVQAQACSAPRNSALTSGPTLSFPTMADCGTGGTTQSIENCAQVVLTACVLEGENGRSSLDGAPGDHGLTVSQSSVFMYDCRLSGGDGGQAQWGFGHGSVAGGSGGDGLQINGGGSEVTVENLTAIGGLGAQSPTPIINFDISGCHGESIRGGQTVELVRNNIALEAPAVIPGDTAVMFRISGTPGTMALLMSTPIPSYRSFNPITGPLLLASPRRGTVHGPIPASGVLDIPISTSNPSTPEGSVQLHFQALMFDPPWRLLTEPRFVVFVHNTL